MSEPIHDPAADELPAADVERIESHLGRLFASVQPGPLLEDRTINALRLAHTRRLLRGSWKRRLALGIAASVGLGLTGAGMSYLGENGRLPMPGGSGRLASDSELHIKMVPEQTVLLYGVESAKPPAGTRDADSLARTLGERNRGNWSEHESLALNGRGNSLSRLSDKQPDLTNPDRGLDPTLMSGVETNGTWAYPANGKLEYSKSPLPVVRNDTYAFNGVAPVAPLDQSFSNGDTANHNFRHYYAESTLGRAKVAEPRPEKLGFVLPQKEQDLKEKKQELPEALAGTSTTPLARFVVPQPAAPADPAVNRKIVIRSGDIDFEVESFDAAVATALKLVGGIKDGTVSTINSEKLPNGKVKGSVVVRVPPEHLDSLVLDLRKELGKTGELKGQKIGSQEITKQYTDLESRLKAAKTMEQRLLKIIAEGKGEIKLLLEAEKELGVWRTKIEESEGELRYYANLVALSTLTIALSEKEIRSATGLTESERVQTGIEVEDVDKALQQAILAVTDAKGRVTKSEMKQLAAGQFNATLHFEVAPDAAGPMRDRLRQIGRIARLEIDRVQQADGATVPKNAKVTRGDAQFQVSIYNLAGVAPREAAVLQIAVADVPAGYTALKEAIGKANGRVLASTLNEQDRQNVSAQLDFEVRRADEPALQAALAAVGDLVSRNVTRAADTENVTDSKVMFRTTLVSAARLKPRETTTLAVEVADVDATASVFGAQVGEVKGRQVDAQITHERTGRVTARLVYDVPLAAAAGIVEKFKTAGAVRVNQSGRDPQAPDGRYATARIDVTLSNADPLVANDDGLGKQVRNGLSFSANALLLSVSWVIFGLCVILPWAVVGYGGYRLVRRLTRTPPPTV